MITSISPEQLNTLRQNTADLCLLDVRTPMEYTQLGHIPGSRLIPVQVLAECVDQLNPAQPTVVICEHGVRSAMACEYLAQQGFTQLYNLAYGMAEWPGERDFNQHE